MPRARSEDQALGLHSKPLNPFKASDNFDDFSALWFDLYKCSEVFW